VDNEKKAEAIVSAIQGNFAMRAMLHISEYDSELRGIVCGALEVIDDRERETPLFRDNTDRARWLDELVRKWQSIPASNRYGTDTENLTDIIKRGLDTLDENEQPPFGIDLTGAWATAVFKRDTTRVYRASEDTPFGEVVGALRDLAEQVERQGHPEQLRLPEELPVGSIVRASPTSEWPDDLYFTRLPEGHPHVRFVALCWDRCDNRGLPLVTYQPWDQPVSWSSLLSEHETVTVVRRGPDDSAPSPA
jgi:hypothetical protein